MITLVLAGSLSQFEYWCREVGVNPRDRSVVRYVSRVEDVLGISQQELRMVVYGTFWSRRDAVELYEWTCHVVETSGQ